MDSPQNSSELAIRRLTTAIWALVAVAALGLGLAVAGNFRPAPAEIEEDPIVGQWLWIKPTNHEHEILPNGTLLCGGEAHGTWRPLEPDKRKYELFWRGRWKDMLTLSPDGNSLVGTNNDGEVIEAKRAAFSAAMGTPRNTPAPRPPEMTPTQAAREAAVIILVRYTEDGDRLKATVSEILKQEPGTDFNFRVGDEYGSASFKPRDNTGYGTGSIVFLRKSLLSAPFLSVQVYDSIPAFDDMSVNDFRRLLGEERSGSAQRSSGAAEP